MDLYLTSELFEYDSELSMGLPELLHRSNLKGYGIVTNKIPSLFRKINQIENYGITEVTESGQALRLTVKEGFIIDEAGNRYNNLKDVLKNCKVFNRIAKIERNTNETKIEIEVNLDGSGKSSINTGIGFFDHMLEQISRHANIDLGVIVKGDLHVDEHHTVEDTGIALGCVIKSALGDKSGIKRYGYFIPMDDSAAQCSIDLGGRTWLKFECEFRREKVGEFPTELVEEFFRGLAGSLGANIHISCVGKNEHHKIEAIFKVFAKALNEACRFDERTSGLPSTKGVL